MFYVDSVEFCEDTTYRTDGKAGNESELCDTGRGHETDSHLYGSYILDGHEFGRLAEKRTQIPVSCALPLGQIQCSGLWLIVAEAGDLLSVNDFQSAFRMIVIDLNCVIR